MNHLCSASILVVGKAGWGLFSEFLCFVVATLDLLADHGHCGGEVPQEEDEEAEAAH